MAKAVKKSKAPGVKRTPAAPRQGKHKSDVMTMTKPKKAASPKRSGPGLKKAMENTIIHWLGGAMLMSQSIRSDFDLIHAGSTGIPKASVDELANHLGISRKSMAEDILDLSVKTLERKAPSDKLDKKTSSHALEIARVMQHAFDVFEDEEKVKRWINKENRGLNGMKPVALFGTLTGLNMVNEVLGRIEEGVYS